MNVTKDGSNLLIELEEEENEVIEYLMESRGSTYVKNQLEFWLKGRFDTIREELIHAIIEGTLPTTIKGLREKLKEKQESNG